MAYLSPPIYSAIGCCCRALELAAADDPNACGLADRREHAMRKTQ